MKGTGSNAQIAVRGDQVQVRMLRPCDIPAGMRLKQAAGWNQTFRDWVRFAALEPEGSFVACHGGRVVGTITTCVFHPVAWIGMMLVDPDYRRRGIATRLMQAALHRLDEGGCTSIYLDATEMGAPLYKRLGFQVEQEIARLGGSPSITRRPSQVLVRGFRWSDWTMLGELDREVSGADRTKLLKRLLIERPESARLVSRDGRLSGFVLDRPGSNARFIGPLIARNADVGLALVIDALQRNRQRRCVVDIPVQNQIARGAVEDAGMTAQRYFLRMVRGVPLARSVHLWASSGPEKG